MDGIGSTKSPGTLGITTPDDPLVPTLGQKKPVNTPLPIVGTQGDGSSQPVLDPPKMMSMEDMMLALQALQSKVMDQQAVSSKNDIQANLAKKTNENALVLQSIVFEKIIFAVFLERRTIFWVVCQISQTLF